MSGWIPFWPDTAGDTGIAVNNLFIAELALSALIMTTVVAMTLTFCVRYRRNSPYQRSDRIQATWHFEIGWTVATLGAFLVLFVWGAQTYIWLYQAPAGDIEIHVVGKRWMWKIQHPGGQAEINALHVPVDKTIRLVIGSQDVIHSFFVPAFRIKHDAVPGTMQVLWFKATKIGTYKLECTQYCGLNHATMRGNVIVTSLADYTRWLSEQGVSQSLAEQGRALFLAHGCSGCHAASSTVHAPSLAGLYGTFVNLQNGTTRLADEAYIHDSIVAPNRDIVAGFAPVMPDYSGQLDEGEVMQLVAYIKSLASQETVR